MSGDFPSLASVFYPSHCVPTILMLKDKPFVHLLWSLNSLPTSSGSNSRATIPTPEENWQLWLFWDTFSRVILIGRDVCLTYWLEFNHFLTHTHRHTERQGQKRTHMHSLLSVRIKIHWAFQHWFSSCIYFHPFQNIHRKHCTAGNNWGLKLNLQILCLCKKELMPGRNCERDERGASVLPSPLAPLTSPSTVTF